MKKQPKNNLTLWWVMLALTGLALLWVLLTALTPTQEQTLTRMSQPMLVNLVKDGSTAVPEFAFWVEEPLEQVTFLLRVQDFTQRCLELGRESSFDPLVYRLLVLQELDARFPDEVGEVGEVDEGETLSEQDGEIRQIQLLYPYGVGKTNANQSFTVEDPVPALVIVTDVFNEDGSPVSSINVFSNDKDEFIYTGLSADDGGIVSFQIDTPGGYVFGW